VRVLQAVVEIGGAPLAAEALGISETTVKTHLRNLFQKTDCRRQADLVKLVAGAASPFG
jgi:DNA-binding CsgD family transcriptional regulator